MGPPRLHRTALVRQDSYFFEAPEDELQAIVRGLEEAHADFQAALLLLILLIRALLIFLILRLLLNNIVIYGYPW